MNTPTDNGTHRPTSRFSWLPVECALQLVLVVLVVGAAIERIGTIA